MSRRYLTLKEAEAVIRRGKTVEVFLGGFEQNSQNCIRWAVFNSSSDGFEGSLWEAIDQGSEDYLDIYTFDSPSGEYDEPVKIIQSPSLESAANMLGITELNFVNQGVVQDEYGSYLESRT
jgi:hypothetical protein